MTPVRELSLIAFPIRELFEVKLNDFDLIIFDRYRRRGVLPSIYIDNVPAMLKTVAPSLKPPGPSLLEMRHYTSHLWGVSCPANPPELL